MKTRLMHSALITHAGRQVFSCGERQKGTKSKQRVICWPVCNTRLHCQRNLLGLLFGNDLESEVEQLCFYTIWTCTEKVCSTTLLWEHIVNKIDCCITFLAQQLVETAGKNVPDIKKGKKKMFSDSLSKLTRCDCFQITKVPRSPLRPMV